LTFTVTSAAAPDTQAAESSTAATIRVVIAKTSEGDRG
jgi:hypothetical protein